MWEFGNLKTKFLRGIQGRAALFARPFRLVRQAEPVSGMNNTAL
jgi:hypothetical protein